MESREARQPRCVGCGVWWRAFWACGSERPIQNSIQFNRPWAWLDTPATLRTVIRAMAAASKTSKDRPVMLCAAACRILLDAWRRRRAKLPHAWPEKRRDHIDDAAPVVPPLCLVWLCRQTRRACCQGVMNVGSRVEE